MISTNKIQPIVKASLALLLFAVLYSLSFLDRSDESIQLDSFSFSSTHTSRATFSSVGHLEKKAVPFSILCESIEKEAKEKKESKQTTSCDQKHPLFIHLGDRFISTLAQYAQFEQNRLNRATISLVILYQRWKVFRS
jgi:hypothetical protein